jgi:TetR/AcrR family transcriptional regulator, transcriptional repressor for nem operon
MRRSREEKAQVHERILDIASARIREAGIDGPSVAEIMQAAGLTHGGFYKHFRSRDDLIAEAADRAFTESDGKVHEITDDARDPLAAFVDWYLSAHHRDDAAHGCAVAALGRDVAHASGHVRSAYDRQVERYLSNLQRLLDRDSDARGRAIVALTMLVGAINLARAIDDHELSDEVLRTVREALKP